MQLPPLRAMHAFECFGRHGSISAAARELNVTSGAVSQQIKILEDHLSTPLIMKDGRKASLTPLARSYHEALSVGFDQLKQAQHLLSQQKTEVDVHVSGLPTMLLSWLNPRLHRFQALHAEAGIRLEATHVEPDPQFLDHMFRLTYGAAAGYFLHSRELFRDICFPVCSPEFLEKFPHATDENKLATLPWIDIDWGPAYANVPRLRDWFAEFGIEKNPQKPVSIHSLSSSALQAAVEGQGVTLAQSSFVSYELEAGRLVKLSDKKIDMPDSYFICWGASTLDYGRARDFLNWVVAEAKNQ